MSYDADLKLFIDGSWRSGEDRERFAVVNPADAKPIAELPLATDADLDEALAAAERAFPLWRATDVEKRGTILRNLFGGEDFHIRRYETLSLGKAA